MVICEEEMSVYIQNGLRKIAPYYNARSSFVKGRWFGKSLTQVFIDEFSQSQEEAEAKIAEGSIKLLREGKPLNGNPVIKNKDILVTYQHNHEPPVKYWGPPITDEKHVVGIPVVHQNEELLVINKPSGIPVHPTAYFYKNTLTELLRDHLGYPVHPCYRLDKITSGLLILAKNPLEANRVQSKIRDRDMKKYYLARVNGRFPDTAVDKSPIYTCDLRIRSEPFSQLKDAHTEFELMKYDAKKDESIVLCKPFTGRTHQIRIHLARLGHPIVNDPFYNLKNSTYPLRSRFIIETPDWTQLTTERIEKLRKRFEMELDDVWDDLNEDQPRCEKCNEEMPKDPTPESLELYLHAWKYHGLDIEFETELPSWAAVDE
ncbi:pseudouridylate synthase 6 [Kluyveromyces marxianus]|uniref:Pseudouridylate synthase 6 n=2 Tax=Kluyveromyces marxianus TaxID=4911 RepID=W0T786_KLUMD|nr:pseudouridylate synthase 6 [Kluyveromyces marxianus DMKU3-1042]QGN15189.1 pseudouridylate synthase 6 [Kluyveromyces marxianus]BAO39472.1 pseudouridylate synthase 6 [Kluyveromyces marxianus DMKU3-1042]